MSQLNSKCSCVVCQEEMFVCNIKQHHFHKHDQCLYPKKPKSFGNCKHCHTEIRGYGKDKKEFCNRSCAASYNNIGRVVSQETKEKRSKSLKAFISNNPNNTTSTNKKLVCHVSWCKICNNQIRNKIRKTCSIECGKQWSSLIMMERIKNGYNPQKHRGRDKRSYMESSFEQWITSNFPLLSFDTEKPFRRMDHISKTYFADFYFPTLELIIELDGSQHLSTQEYDRERDEYISTTYGLNVIRISHKEYQSKSRLSEIEDLLSK